MLKVIKLAIMPLLFVVAVHAQTPQPTPNPADQFDKKSSMVAMRDGAKLYTEYFVPKKIDGPLPIILMRTPYGISGWFERSAGGFLKELVDEGYIFAFQDIRGRYKSEGVFVMTRPLRKSADPKAFDEATDTYDTIDWLVKTIPNNNGRVGMFGTSYDGWLTIMALLEPHPALKAACEQASPADEFIGDDFHHNGAFRLSYGFEYAFQLESSKEDANFEFDRYDTYDWYLKLGALSNVDAKYFHGKLPTWTNFVNHPNYDDVWKERGLASQLKPITVPTMHVSGWWDQEDFYGPQRAYEILERTDTNNLNFIVIGPWNHGGWERREGDKLGNIDFGSSTSRHFRERIRAPWFAYFLKNKGQLKQAEAMTFQTGANKWMTYDAWPPRQNISKRPIYFRGDEKLSFTPPSTQGVRDADSYVSDPAHPVPYRARPIEPTYNPTPKGGSRWYTWLLDDQRFVHGRADVLSWETDELKDDVVISGNVVAQLFASTTGSDGDFVVKLIDVYPQHYEKEPKMSGYQLMVANDIMRGRFRNSYEKPEPMVPNRVTEITLPLYGVDHRFQKGHRIMVQVQSTWFPLYDRNPQKFVPNIYKAVDADYQPATVRILRSKRYPSNIALPVRK